MHVPSECKWSKQIWETFSNTASLPSFSPEVWNIDASISEWFNDLGDRTEMSSCKGARGLAN